MLVFSFSFPFFSFFFFFFAAWQKGHTFLVKKKNPRSIIQSPVNTANFFGLLVTVLTGFHCKQVSHSKQETISIIFTHPSIISILLPPKYSVTVQRHYLDLTGNAKNHCRSTGRKTPQGPLYCKRVSWIKLQKKKKNTAKTVYDQSCSTSDPKRSWSVKIDQIENVTVKKTFAGTDQTTWNRVKLHVKAHLILRLRQLSPWASINVMNCNYI